MKRLSFVKLILAGLCLLVLLPSCSISKNAVNAMKTTPLVVPSAELVGTHSPTIVTKVSNKIETPTPSVAPSPAPEAKLMNQPLPTLLFQTPSEDNTCDPKQRSEIWLASYPYKSPHTLLADPDIDYRLPTWSPDGEWIAYIETKRSILQENMITPSSKITGTDTVWIMHPDGSGRRKISDSTPSGLLAHILGKSVVCDPLAMMIALRWSPDGRYIFFTRMSLFREEGIYSYYVAEVSTGKTRLMLTQMEGNDPIWDPKENKFFLLSDENLLDRVIIEGIDKIKIEKFSFLLPDEVKNPIAYFFKASNKTDVFYAFFYLNISKLPAQKYSHVLVFDFDISTDKWEKITTIPVEEWRETAMLPEIVLECAKNNRQISFIDPNNWNLVGKMEISSQPDLDCDSIMIYRDKLGRSWGIYESWRAETKGLWAIPLKPGIRIEPELILRYSFIEAQPFHLIRYEFQPLQP